MGVKRKPEKVKVVNAKRATDSLSPMLEVSPVTQESPMKQESPMTQVNNETSIDEA